MIVCAKFIYSRPLEVIRFLLVRIETQRRNERNNSQCCRCFLFLLLFYFCCTQKHAHIISNSRFIPHTHTHTQTFMLNWTSSIEMCHLCEIYLHFPSLSLSSQCNQSNRWRVIPTTVERITAFIFKYFK